MHWIYILRCEDDIFYVGTTKRLYRRFWEHNDGNGGINTSIYRPIEIVAIYKVEIICKFIEYNNGVLHDFYSDYKLNFFNKNEPNDDYDKLEGENNIAECMMMHNKDTWKNIRGGKYVRFDCNYSFPYNEAIKELPLCHCGLPCDIIKNEQKKHLFFRCAKKNMWDDMKDLHNINNEPCKFYREYTSDIEYRIESKKNFENRKKKYKDLLYKSLWLKNIPYEEENELGECVYCKTYVWNDGEGNFKNNGIKRNNKRLLLCKKCFINKNDELKKIYDPFRSGKCLIKI